MKKKREKDIGLQAKFYMAVNFSLKLVNKRMDANVTTISTN